MKVRILYNSCNVDSCLAVNMLIKVMKAQKANHYFETVPFTKFDNHQISIQDSAYTFIVGAQVDIHVILEEKEKSNKVVFFNYINHDYTPEQLVAAFSAGVDIFIPNYVCGEFYTEVETILDNSLCKLMSVFLNKEFNHDIYADAESNFEEIALIQAVMHYINFDKALTEQELVYLYSNYDQILYCAANTKPFKLLPILSDTDFKPLSEAQEVEDEWYTGKPKLQDCSRIQTARAIIHRNLSHTLHGVQNNSRLIPTACVAEEHALDALRMMSYPYPLVVTYEDVKYWRIWRLYSKDQIMVLDAMSVIEHKLRWTENKVTYLMSTIPGVK